MANVNYWFGYWLAASEVDALAPGEVHDWIAWPHRDVESIGISANPLDGGEEHALAVENMSLESDAAGQRMVFSVRNVGRSQVDAYGIGYSHVSQ
jgi:hypothetical protein